MNTLNRFRDIAFGLTLLAVLAIAFALLARDGLGLPAPGDKLVACSTSKGALCVSSLAERLHVGAPATDSVADLGGITVVARRDVDRVADLGSLTVTARRYTSVAANLAENAVHSWE